MKCPKCGFERPDQETECFKCGIVFEKYIKYQELLSKAGGEAATEADDDCEMDSMVKDLLLSVEPKVNPFHFAGRILAFLIIVIWGFKLIVAPLETNYAGKCFLHMANLPFHEAGHIFFRPFGRLIMSLGGTLGQLSMPMICFVALIISRNTFGASVAFWWLGENFIDIAPYVNDARALRLMLLGGVTGDEAEYGFHDWQFILTETRLLKYDHTLAHLSQFIGIAIILVSFAWGGYLLFKQYKNLESL